MTRITNWYHPAKANSALGSPGQRGSAEAERLRAVFTTQGKFALADGGEEEIEIFVAAVKLPVSQHPFQGTGLEIDRGAATCLDEINDATHRHLRVGAQHPAVVE